MSSVYRCKRAAFSKRAKCYTRSIVPSYPAIAGVREFIGRSSAITNSVKGLLASPPLGLLQSGTAHPEDPPGDILNGRASRQEILEEPMSGCLASGWSEGQG
ncbi:UNVERIFIED_CONTAM: hypothetical protein Sradi_2361400 [Sesamum radiatum]|uniref:Uncharacterized protein n=1 Tax=Sesamum radiatum TaxID=300843 RepID=A0AAW2T8Z5_SESRA